MERARDGPNGHSRMLRRTHSETSSVASGPHTPLNDTPAMLSLRLRTASSVPKLRGSRKRRSSPSKAQETCEETSYGELDAYPLCRASIKMNGGGLWQPQSKPLAPTGYKPAWESHMEAGEDLERTQHLYPIVGNAGQLSSHSNIICLLTARQLSNDILRWIHYLI